MNKQNQNLPENSALEALGFKCGLEIHQQIDTKTKLFCHCPVGLTNERHDAEILRHMRPTLSELGEYDGTALMEFKTRKEVIYRLFRDRTCTYEMDDTPPFLVNPEAVDMAIRVALLFNCKIINELHVIRKQYLDGSIPTGFQRTMIIGIDGWIPYKDRIIHVTQVNLEEDSCREVSDIGHTIVFSTDRLSIPLVEIITAPEMKNPDEATEVCRLLGNAMKDAKLVRRGIGTVRQDVNVSITGSPRVEIKGVYKVGNIKALTAIEAIRHKSLLELKKIINERFELPESIKYEELNIIDRFNGFSNVISRHLESDEPYKVIAMHLPQMVDIINYKLQPGKDFGFELSARVRVIACIDFKPNLFFYSQRENYDIPESFWAKLSEDFKASQKDDIVIICGPSQDVYTAQKEIKIRIAELSSGVPDETRQDVKDGTTDFERILPGPDRMYPDTDHPPVKITAERVQNNQDKMSEPLWDKQKRWREIPISESLIKALSLSQFQSIFDKLIANNSINPSKAAHLCAEFTVGLRRAGYDLVHISESVLFDFLHTALTRDWPYRRLKSDLIRLADGSEWTEAEHPEIDDDQFAKIWDESCKLFDCKEDNATHDKLRKFVSGKILDKYTGASKVIERINAKINSL